MALFVSRAPTAPPPPPRRVLRSHDPAFRMRVDVVVPTVRARADGIAQAVALTMFEGPDASAAVRVPLYYGFVEAVVMGTCCVCRRAIPSPFFGWLLLFCLASPAIAPVPRAPAAAVSAGYWASPECARPSPSPTRFF